jgi:hypothetical protein
MKIGAIGVSLGLVEDEGHLGSYHHLIPQMWIFSKVQWEYPDVKGLVSS